MQHRLKILLLKRQSHLYLWPVSSTGFTCYQNVEFQFCEITELRFSNVVLEIT